METAPRGQVSTAKVKHFSISLIVAPGRVSEISFLSPGQIVSTLRLPWTRSDFFAYFSCGQFQQKVYS